MFFGEFQCLPVDDCSAVSFDFGVLARWSLFFFFNFWLHCVFVAACRLSSSCGEQGLHFVSVCGLPIAVASLVAEHGLCVRGLQ